MPLTTFNRAAYDFFKEHAGGIVGQASVGAANLARAEKIAYDLGWTVDWEGDYSSPDMLGDHDYWCKGNRVEYDDGWRTVECNHEVTCALLRAEDGEVLGSLGGIIDASRDYRRVIEAELAAEAIAEGRHEPAPEPEHCPTCGQALPVAS